MAAPDTFPRQHARTQRFTLGDPRTVTVSPDGERVVFARSSSGDDPVNALWVLDLAPTDGPVPAPRLAADPHVLLGVADDADLPEAERRRRERMREGAGGVTGYACDGRVRTAAFTLAGRLFVADLLAGRDAGARELHVEGPVFDPVPDPAGSQIAYVCGSTLRVAALDGASHLVAGEPGHADATSTISWGSAEFVAAEEMGRHRGHWWSPDGSRLAVCRVDTAPVPTWWIADPAHPDREPTAMRYPAAGSTNADVTLHVVSADGSTTAPLEVVWDRQAFPYLATVSWPRPDLILLSVQSRDQRHLRVLAADPTTGATRTLSDDTDDAWVELVPGTPALAPSGALVRCTDAPGHRALLIGDEIVSPADVQVRSVVAIVGSATDDAVIVTGNPLDDATVLHAYRCRPGSPAEQITHGDAVHTVIAGGSTLVVRRASLDAPGAVTTVTCPDRAPVVLDSFLATPLVRPDIRLRRYGPRALATAVLLPAGHDGSPLPVLLDPYGGPHAQRVVRSSNAHLTSQWFADHGFAVVVTDGRGTPGRGAAWERAVHLDLATTVLDDQVDALHAAADEFPLDLERVGIRGWSFGGYLAALAVIRRPDVFHAAVAGAPVTEWRLYDTHYTERYLGDPTADPAPYDATSLVDEAARLTRPLLLVHGLADDNVVAAHTLRLSSALLAAGRPHEVLPLVGVTHMTPQEVVAENLLLHQLDFLRRHLG